MRATIKVNKAFKYLFLAFLLSWSRYTYSYIHNQTKDGLLVHWSSASTTVDVFVNSDNSQGLSESTVQTIAANSINQWNGISKINIRKNTTTIKNQSDLNELYFSTDPNVFNGSGVIGVTLVSYTETKGEVLSANILINDNYPFSTNPVELNYLGNVITHEMGHFLGMGHGQVAGSTMFYSLTRGQNNITDDDKAGLYSIYPSGDSSKGTISGTIVGGKSLALVFGAHVQAISIKTGKVSGASISEIDGKFKIDGLPKNDQYLIYTSPIRQLGLPTNYSNARSDFCEASTSYRGSFFQSCAASSEGFPQAVRLNSSSMDVGKITIRCGLDTPPEYMQNKSNVNSSFDVNAYSSSGLGGSFVGFFSASDIQNGLQDYFHLNLSHIGNWDNIYPSADLYVELKVLNQSFYSALKANVNIKRNSSNYDVSPKFNQSSTGWINIDTVTRIPINRSVLSDNDFEIKITPEIMDSSHFPTGILFSRYDLFSSYPEIQENLYFYLVSATIVKDNGD